MADPATQEEYEALFHEHMRIEGFGFDIHTILPCPFCAATDWLTLWPAAGIASDDDRPFIDDQLRANTTCAECGRSATHIVERDANGVMTTLVQTGGDDPPSYLPPMKRVEVE